MDPLAVLRREHALLRRMLDSLDQCLMRVESGGSRRDLPRFVLWLRAFLHGMHGPKEEQILLGALQQHGFPMRSGPIGLVEDEHREAADTLSVAADALKKARADDAPSVRPAVIALRSVSHLLRYHTEMEEAAVFPMAEAELPPEALRSVAEQLATQARESSDDPMTMALNRLAQELLVLYPGASSSHRAA
jgi:hemerythrin-like domain-containing protein